ncbi:hypothetical protein [Klebsiella oxytoca]|uniref:hypothetical protein n=1 Tax=Klebsiella oxytoca TaxID=571 RepID=UPI001EE9E8A4|nr:hypothetical protein [Klebsiella oxytoca]
MPQVLVFWEKTDYEIVNVTVPVPLSITLTSKHSGVATNFDVDIIGIANQTKQTHDQYYVVMDSSSNKLGREDIFMCISLSGISPI